MDTSFITHSDDVIQHFGTKGMKWGIRRSTQRKIKKAALIGGGLALAGAAAYAGYKGYDNYKKNKLIRELSSHYASLFDGSGGSRPINKTIGYKKGFNVNANGLRNNVSKLRKAKKVGTSVVDNNFSNLGNTKKGVFTNIADRHQKLNDLLRDLDASMSSSRNAGRHIKDVTNTSW